MTHNQQNLNPGTAYFRFMLGSVMTAYGTVQLLREPKSRSGRMLVLLGSMKAAEGATKFCPRKAMGSIMDKMMSENATQATQSNAGTSMNSGDQYGQNSSNGSARQMNGNIMQMVGNIAQKLTGSNYPQSMQANQNNSGTGQNATGTATQTIGNIAQAVSPQISQIVKDVAGMADSQNTSGTNNTAKQTTSGTTGSANKKNATANSTNTKSASSSNNKQAASVKDNNNTQKSDKQPQHAGAANNSNLDSSVIDTISKSGQQNTSTPNILQ